MSRTKHYSLVTLSHDIVPWFLLLTNVTGLMYVMLLDWVVKWRLA